jgi:hypothetical protein
MNREVPLDCYYRVLVLVKVLNYYKLRATILLIKPLCESWTGTRLIH